MHDRVGLRILEEVARRPGTLSSGQREDGPASDYGAGQALARIRHSGGDVGRGYAGHLPPLHWQLAGFVRRMDDHSRQVDPPDEEDSARTGPVLHGWAMGGLWWAYTVCVFLGTKRHADYLQAGQGAL